MRAGSLSCRAIAVTNGDELDFVHTIVTRFDRKRSRRVRGRAAQSSPLSPFVTRRGRWFVRLGDAGDEGDGLPPSVVRMRARDCVYPMSIRHLRHPCPPEGLFFK